MRTLICLYMLLTGTIAYANPVSDYYDLVNDAELLICKNKFEYALQHYDKAFAIKEMQPWGKDIYNAWVCAYLLNDMPHFKRYSKILVSREAYFNKGPKTTLQAIDSIRAAAYTTIWYELKTQTKSTVDTAYRNRLTKFLNDDQIRRKYCIGLYQGEYNIGGRDTLNTFDSLNVLEMRDFFKVQGFPTEQRTGFWQNDPTYSPVYEIVLMHDRSWTNRKTLDTLLYEQVLAGKFHPGEYALLKGQNSQDESDTMSYYQRNPFTWYCINVFTILDNRLYIEKWQEAKIKKSDLARRDIYLETGRDMYAKGDFQFSHRYFSFFYGGVFAAYNGLPDNIAEKIKKNSYTEEETDAFNTIGMRRCKHGLRH